jgi:hypothetical protein
VEPRPERLQETLAEGLHAARVVPVPARWNLLAHLLLEAPAGRLYGQMLNDYCSALYDCGFGDKAFPLA